MARPLRLVLTTDAVGGVWTYATDLARGLSARGVEVTLAVLGQLESSNNWHRIAREWIYGDEPVTELGKQEAAWAAERGA